MAPSTTTHQEEIKTQDIQPWPPISNTDETKTGIRPTDGKFAKMSRNSSDDIIDFCDNGALSVRSKKRLVDEVEHIEDTGNDRHGRTLRRQVRRLCLDIRCFELRCFHRGLPGIKNIPVR